jgi:hypothetical protein
MVFVTVVAPATVKKSAGTPVKVYPAFGVIVIVAVYIVKGAKVVGFPFQDIVAVYSVVSAMVAVGVTPVTGIVTPEIAGFEIIVVAVEIFGADKLKIETTSTRTEIREFINFMYFFIII